MNHSGKVDLDLSAHRWIPIGSGTNHSSLHSFSGYFDGENHIISGLYVDESAEKYSADLFGHVTLTNAVEEVTLQNLKLTNAYVKSEGGRAGRDRNSGRTYFKRQSQKLSCQRNRNRK